MTVASENSIPDAKVYRKITCCSHSKCVLEPEHSPQELSVTNAVICFIFLLKYSFLSYVKKKKYIKPLFTIQGIKPKKSIVPKTIRDRGQADHLRPVL